MSGIRNIFEGIRDVANLRQLESRFRRDDGKVGVNEARALIREAGKDGKITAAEMQYLQSRAGIGGALSGFDDAARGQLQQFTQHANTQPESSTADSTATLQSMKQDYLSDDGRIGEHEARVMLDEAMSSGRSLSRGEIAFLKQVAADPRTTPEARAKLEQVVSLLPNGGKITPRVREAIEAGAEAVRQRETISNAAEKIRELAPPKIDEDAEKIGQPASPRVPEAVKEKAKEIIQGGQARGEIVGKLREALHNKELGELDALAAPFRANGEIDRDEMGSLIDSVCRRPGGVGAAERDFLRSLLTDPSLTPMARRDLSTFLFQLSPYRGATV